jgi:nucleotide-binding universal stress UspA family protein
VIDSKGLGGLKKLLLGSVSNAVAQEADNCTVIIVK